MALNGRPQVFIYQGFATANFAAPLPTLNVCVVGPAYQIEDFVSSQANIATGAYGTLNGTSAASTGLAPTPSAIDLSEPPQVTSGAVLDAASAQLWVTGAEVNLVNGSTLAFTNNDNFLTGFTTDTSQGFVQAGVLPGDRVVLSDHTNNVTVARTVQNACLSFTDSGAGFIASGVAAGNTLTITLPSAAAGFYTVQRVVSATVLYISQNTPDAVAVGTSATAYSIANGSTQIVSYSGHSAVIADTILEVTSNLSTGAGTDINGNAYATLEYMGLVGRVERLVASANVGGNSAGLVITPGSNAIVISAGMTLPIVLSGQDSATDLTVNFANTFVAYRALLQNLAVNNALTGTAAITGAIGPVDERNPLAVGVFVACQNTTSQVQYFGVTGDYINGATSALSAYTAAMTVLSSDPTVYCIVPLTNELAVITDWSTNCTELAEPTSSVFQIVIGSGTSVTQETVAPAGGVSSTFTAQAASGSAITVFTDSAGAFVTDGVAVGNSLVVSLSTASGLEGTYTVSSVISNTELVVSSATPLPSPAATFTTVSYAIAAATTPISVTAHTVITRAFYSQLVDSTATFITDGVIVSDIVQVMSSAAGNATVLATFPITQINSNNTLTVSSPVGDELGENPSELYYRVLRNLTLNQQVTALSEVVQSPGGLDNSRCVMVFPSEVLVAGVTNVLTGLQDVQPSYYAACAVGGLVAGQPSQQGFTFLPLGGIQSVIGSTGYFSQAQLNTISGAGWFVCVQDTSSTPVYCMREMTTDTTSLETGELQQVKNFDYVSKFFQAILNAYLGTYNVLPETIDSLAAAFNAGANELINNYVAKIGAPISAATLTSIAPLAGEADRIEMYATITMPIPLNDIGLHLTA
jgi:hypothetical protein